jgi:phosphate:Na+ symporter
MKITAFVLQFVGSVAFLLYGMKMMSDGIQKSVGQSLRNLLGMMTGNRVFAALTGLLITMIIQSSGATTVMVVSFVNAGILTLTQSIGVIFGANIGTTVTAWLVLLFKLKFEMAVFAVPVFGVGFLLTFVKRLHKEAVGEALMGFGLLFIGLDFLSSTFTLPELSESQSGFLAFFAGRGALSLLAGIAIGLLATVAVHSSSAITVVIVTMGSKGTLDWELAAAMVLGCNVGSTIDAVLAAVGTKVNARRAALVHVLFNVTGTVLAVLFFHPFLSFVDSFFSGYPLPQKIPERLATLHTVFNAAATLLFLPFVRPIAHLTEKLIKASGDEKPDVYRLEFAETGAKENALAQIIRAEKEISDMAEIADRMFKRLKKGFADRSERFLADYAAFEQEELYADQMQVEVSKFLLRCTEMPLPAKARKNVPLLLTVVSELESMTDDCFTVAVLLKRSIEKEMSFQAEDLERLVPYTDLVQQTLDFIRANLNRRLTPEQFEVASQLESHIDAVRGDLKKLARKRLESGADVKAELLYIDIVRNIEKIGDKAFSISEALFRIKT